MAFALVQKELVSSLFSDIGQDLTDPDRIELPDLFKYFDEYWMKQIPIWNVFNLCETTNNACEETNTADDVLIQISCEMKHRSTAPKTKLAERRMQELYDRFSARTISVK
ncbi:unnamed protein product [Rotaria sp. Silwood2]|nr:unnamed protein product [Rotaria sp. Silwood2]